MADLVTDLLRRDPASIPRLVDALRDIHQGRATPPSLPAPNGLADLLLAGVRQGQQQLAHFLKTAVPPSPGDDYAALRRRVEQFDQLGAERADQARRAVEARAASASPTPYQDSLYLQCRQGGRVSGKFRCLNRRQRRTAVTTTLRSFTVDGRRSAVAPTLAVRPGSFTLEAGAAAVVAVELDFASCPDLVAHPLRTSIDLLMDDAVALKLWVEIEVYDGRL